MAPPKTPEQLQEDKEATVAARKANRKTGRPAHFAVKPAFRVPGVSFCPPALAPRDKRAWKPFPMARVDAEDRALAGRVPRPVGQPI
eukprot:282899-Pyramimonas_sp.AAC.1